MNRRGFLSLFPAALAVEAKPVSPAVSDPEPEPEFMVACNGPYCRGGSHRMHGWALPSRDRSAPASVTTSLSVLTEPTGASEAPPTPILGEAHARVDRAPQRRAIQQASDDARSAGDRREFLEPPLAEHRRAVELVALLRHRADDLVTERLVRDGRATLVVTQAAKCPPLSVHSRARLPRRSALPWCRVGTRANAGIGGGRM